VESGSLARNLMNVTQLNAPFRLPSNKNLGKHLSRGFEKFLLQPSAALGIPLHASAAVGHEDHCVREREKGAVEA
jgi:hypothetical protein